MFPDMFLGGGFDPRSWQRGQPTQSRQEKQQDEEINEANRAPQRHREPRAQHLGDGARLKASERRQSEEGQVVEAHDPAPHFRRADNLKRSEEHTSELQSPCNLVCRLLLEKKKRRKSIITTTKTASN